MNKKKNQKWEATIRKLKKGDFVNGVVQKEVNFGYFIKMDSGIEGLLHKDNIGKNREIKLNETIQVKVINIDTVKKQIVFTYK